MSSFQEDLERARWDIAFFAERFLGIKIHPGQKRFADIVSARDSKRWWVAAYLTICLSAGNRAGKTMILAIVILHSCLYKVGTKPPSDEDHAKVWQTRPYLWFHFAIQQEVSELAYTEIVTILQGIHRAQGPGGCPLANEIPDVASWEKKYNGDYRWIVLNPILGGAEIHFRTTAEKALGSLGRDMNGLSMDECGFQGNLSWTVNNVFHLRRLGTGGQMLLVSTPEEGLTEFSDLWYLGDPDSPDQQARKMSLRMSSRENIGYGLHQEEFDALTADMDEAHIAQNIDGYFIQGRTAYFNHLSVDAAFVDELPELAPAKDKHSYVQGVDPALRHDSTWSVVLDVLAEDRVVGVCAEYIRGKQTTPAIVGIAMDAHNAYDVNRSGLRSHCSTAIDATGFGGKLFKEALEVEIESVRAVEFGGSIQKKRKLLGDLRTMLDSGRLKMPRSGAWLKGRRQLLGYKIDDRALEQDFVMALAVAISEVRRSPADAQDSVPFDFYSTSLEDDGKFEFDWRRPARTA